MRNENVIWSSGKMRFLNPSVYLKRGSSRDSYNYPAEQIIIIITLFVKQIGDKISEWECESSPMLSLPHLLENYDNFDFSDPYTTSPTECNPL